MTKVFLSRQQIDSVAHLPVRAAASQLGVGKTSVSKYRNIYYPVGSPVSDSETVSTAQVPDSRMPRILALDLETSPNLAHVWGLWQQNVGLNQLLESTEVICFGARWLGTDEVIIKSVQRDGKDAMLKEAHRLLDEADAMMGWNSKGFDMKHLNREFIENGFLPPSPTAQLDLMQEVKRNFRFPSNKLDYVSQALGFEGKVKHSGHTLWIRCMAGEEAAWDEMYEYQKQDVDLLIDIYEKLKPWLKGVPNAGLFDPDKSVACVVCGSVRLRRSGVVVLGSGTYPRFQCEDCGKWQKSFKRESTTEMRVA